MKKIRVTIIDDDLIASGFTADCINSIGFCVTASASNFSEALIALKKNNTDIVLIEINFCAPWQGIDIARIIKDNYQIPFIYITHDCDIATIEKAKSTHPYGYIIKPFLKKQLLVTIEMARFYFARKNRPIQYNLTREIINKNISQSISKREFEILQLMVDGQTNQNIAENLFVSINTVKTHVASVICKFEASSRIDVIVKVREWFRKL